VLAIEECACSTAASSCPRVKPDHRLPPHSQPRSDIGNHASLQLPSHAERLDPCIRAQVFPSAADRSVVQQPHTLLTRPSTLSLTRRTPPSPPYRQCRGITHSLQLAFGLTETAGYVKYVWQDGAWGQQEWVPGSQIQIPVGSVALNYGASCFEGLKAFRQPDGQVKLFRPDENAKRLCHSAHIVSMPELPQDLFYEACHTAVAKNLQFVPPHAPHGAAGSLYVRPLLFASGAELVPMAPKTFTFVVWVTPTGSLYGTAGGKAPAVDAFVIEEFDRAAPRGGGPAKLAGNYAPVFRHQQKAKSQGYAITLHLDSQNRTHIDEFSTSNFIGIKKPAAADEKPTLVVPASESILKSVTTKSLIGIAESFGWQVERRPVPFQEVIDGGLSEVMACGTAAASRTLYSFL
jgi:branched-chain amino acid aminotransferase